ncbi:MAG TPA: ABC transporter permease, partial [Candidatus Angelobacter sp.]
MRPFIQDLFFSFRSLRRNPGFTIVAVLTLALGIGGTIVIFTIIDASILRPLPYPGPDSLIILHWQDQGDISAEAFFMVRSQAHSFSSLSASYPADVGVNISATGSPQYVKALSVSKDFFQTLGILPVVGNPFSAEDDQPQAAPTAILSYGLWTESFNRDTAALGRDLPVNGKIFKIIGI